MVHLTSDLSARQDRQDKPCLSVYFFVSLCYNSCKAILVSFVPNACPAVGCARR